METYFTDSVADQRTRYATIKAAMLNERSTFEPHWRTLSDYLLPRRTRFFAGDRNQGDPRSQKILDSTGRFSVRTLQSGLHAGLTSPARPWMKVTTPDPKLAKMPPVKQWLAEVTTRMLAVFTQTNLYNVLPIVYGDMGVFGTGCMGVIADSRDLFRCYAYPLGSYAIGLDKRGLANSFVRDYRLSVRQVVEDFGLKADRKTIDWTKLSTHVKSAWDKSQYETPVDLTWIVLANPFPNPRRLEAKYKPWTSCHYEENSSEPKFLRESGFETFPILAPRWDVTGEDTYGTDCPGMTALPDVKQLQDMTRAKAKAIQKLIDPPVVAPASLQTKGVSLLPGNVTYVDVPSAGNAMRSIHDVQIRVDHLINDIGATQNRVQRAFYEDLFLMLASADAGGQPITAAEVHERHEEKLLALGPVLERTNDELLEPLIDRVYQMMDAVGLIPPPPAMLEGVRVKAQYTSIMAEAQKLVGVVGLDRFLMSTTPLVQTVAPATRHKIDYNKIVDAYADALGIDPSIVRSDDDADALAAQEAQAAQRGAEAEQAQKMAAALKSAGTTPMDGDTALSRIVGGAGGGAGVDAGQ